MRRLLRTISVSHPLDHFVFLQMSFSGVTVKVSHENAFIRLPSMREKVLCLKEEISRRLCMPVEGQMLAYKGKELNDEDVLEDIGITPDDFVVLALNLKGYLNGELIPKKETPPQEPSTSPTINQVLDFMRQVEDDGETNRDDSMRTLQDMGFSAENASRALLFSGGDIELASSLLLQGGEVMGMLDRQLLRGSEIQAGEELFDNPFEGESDSGDEEEEGDEDDSMEDSLME